MGGYYVVLVNTMGYSPTWKVQLQLCGFVLSRLLTVNKCMHMRVLSNLYSLSNGCHLCKESVVRGHHVSKDVWAPFVGEILDGTREDENSHDRLAVSVVFES